MSSYCLKCRKNTECINPRVSKTNNGETVLSKCAICGSKKSRFVQKQEASGVSNLGLKTQSNKISLLGDILFWMQFYWAQFHWMQL